MKIILSLLTTVFILWITSAFGRLEPTKLFHGGVYRLEIQSEDKFLTSIDGTATRARWTSRPEQKWKFSEMKDSTVNEGKSTWTLGPVNGKPGIPTTWKIVYVGHGKFRMESLTSGLCLAGFGSNAVGERKCEKDSPYQRWLIQEVK